MKKMDTRLEDRKINVASRVLTRKNAPPPGGHVFQPTGIIFELVQDIIGINLLTKFHEDWTINVASRVKNALPLGGHLIQDMIKINLLTKFHEDWTINVASRPYLEKCPAPWRPCFSTTGIIFELVQDIIGINLLTKFHEDWTINVASRVKNAPPHGRHVFQAKTNLLSKFHEDRKIMWPLEKNAPSSGGHVFQPTSIIFELVQDIIKMNILTKFHEDRTINVAS
ncbi:hypothetical protein DPMN_115684 [Dreissena polymorpha]|uniref:Uncharacterized protein n=1 Tax=Dreissena polymorpha TaxID=45954 RepID=A0A9D4QSV3_DREPO|nr:hypothetical protein DPMN_115684 [Dreissena polymorpha]